MASSAGLPAQTIWRRMSGGKAEEGRGYCHQAGER